MLTIRLADKTDFITVRDFYDTLIDAMQDAVYAPKWEKDVYPARSFLLRSIENGELYLGEEGGTVVACMVVNHEYNEGYNAVRWSLDAADDALYVLHVLGVHPAYAGQGIAKQMVGYVIELARSNGIRSIRLDVLSGNLPAEKVYRAMGFRCLDTVSMFYEDTGWTDFMLFERPV